MFFKIKSSFIDCSHGHCKDTLSQVCIHLIGNKIVSDRVRKSLNHHICNLPKWISSSLKTLYKSLLYTESSLTSLDQRDIVPIPSNSQITVTTAHLNPVAYCLVFSIILLFIYASSS